MKKRDVVLGLDVSTHLGYCVFSEGVVEKGTFHIPPERKGMKNSDPDRFKRWDIYGMFTSTLIDKHQPSAVYIEGYAFGKPFGMVRLVELGTLVRLSIAKAELPWYEVSPMTIKSFVTGSGKSKKNMMLMEVFRRWDIQCADDNEADAVSLAIFGAVHRSSVHAPVMTAAQIKAVARFDKLNKGA